MVIVRVRVMVWLALIGDVTSANARVNMRTNFVKAAYDVIA